MLASTSTATFFTQAVPFVAQQVCDNISNTGAIPLIAVGVGIAAAVVFAMKANEPETKPKTDYTGTDIGGVKLEDLFAFWAERAATID